MNTLTKFIIFSMLSVFTLTAHSETLKVKWSSAGKIKGAFKHCIAINEPLEAKTTTWDDNFLCFNKKNHGFKYSYNGRITDLKCKPLNIKGGAWADNFVCGKENNFAFFQRQLPGGYRCIRITELADSNPRANGTQGNSNHFCLKK